LLISLQMKQHCLDVLRATAKWGYCPFARYPMRNIWIAARIRILKTAL